MQERARREELREKSDEECHENALAREKAKTIWKGKQNLFTIPLRFEVVKGGVRLTTKFSELLEQSVEKYFGARVLVADFDFALACRVKKDMWDETFLVQTY